MSGNAVTFESAGWFGCECEEESRMAPGLGPEQPVGGEQGRRNDLGEMGAQCWSLGLPIKSQVQMSPALGTV